MYFPLSSLDRTPVDFSL